MCSCDSDPYDDDSLASEGKILRRVRRSSANLIGEDGSLQLAAFMYDHEDSDAISGCSVNSVQVADERSDDICEIFDWTSYRVAVLSVADVREPIGEESDGFAAGVIRDPIDQVPTHCLIRVLNDHVKDTRRKSWFKVRAILRERAVLVDSAEELHQALASECTAPA